MSVIQFLKRENERNAGDAGSSPLQYFRFAARARRFCTHRLFESQRPSPRLPLILGGGGLDYWRPKLARVVEERQGPLIAWGMGLNRHEAGAEDDYPPFYDELDLAGVRDFGKRFGYVPCVSALHPLLRAQSFPRERVVVYEHAEKPLPIRGLPRVSNAIGMERSLLFLLQGEFVVTNTYHGAYWATLLGKKTLVIPLERASRFYFFKDKPILSSLETWSDDLERACAYPHSLEESIERNLDFSRKVASLLEIGNLTQEVAMKRMRACCVCDESYAAPLAVTLLTALEKLRSGWEMDLAILHSPDLREETKRKITRSVGDPRIAWRWFEVDPRPFRGLPTPNANRYAGYFKFLLGERLDPCWGKVVFLDCDLLVERDLVTLWEQPLDDKIILAVQDLAVPFTGSVGGIKFFRKLLLRGSEPFFNSGVMLVDLAGWRRHEAGRRLLQFSKEWRRSLRSFDQEAFNFVFLDRWKALPPRWNLIYSVSNEFFRSKEARNALRDSAPAPEDQIVHFAGAYKPWLLPMGDAPGEKYYEALDRTAWRGWRPEATTRRNLKTAYLRYGRRFFHGVEKRLVNLARDLRRELA